MENRYSSAYDRQAGSNRWRSSEEFQEVDVWGSAHTRSKDDSYNSRMIVNSPKEPSFILKRLPAASRMIPKSAGNKNSTSLQDPKTVQHSAPVNIPDWSKIYRTKSTSKSSYSSWQDADSDNHGNDEHGFALSSWESDDDDEDDEDGEGNMIPPHEWVAQKLARRQISSFSVCEGAGRTLKGRDLSRVRNDVLTKTGFLESNHPNF